MPISIDEIHKIEDNRKKIKKETYKKIYDQVSKKVKNAVDLGHKNVFVRIPTFILGLPSYDVEKACIYVQRQFTNGGFYVCKTSTIDLYISWCKEKNKKHSSSSKSQNEMDTDMIDDPSLPSLVNLKKLAADSEADGSSLMKRLDEIVKQKKTEAAASGIMETIPKVDLPGKRATSREFLVNSLKVGDEFPSTTLNDVISAEDMKFIMEGGGGVMGDPIVLVQKYFGPRVAEMMPASATTEEMALLTKRILNNVEDAKGFRPDEPGFDPLTAKIVEFDGYADGGRAGYAKGGLAKILEL